MSKSETYYVPNSLSYKKLKNHINRYIESSLFTKRYKLDATVKKIITAIIYHPYHVIIKKN